MSHIYLASCWCTVGNLERDVSILVQLCQLLESYYNNITQFCISLLTDLYFINSDKLTQTY